MRKIFDFLGAAIKSTGKTMFCLRTESGNGFAFCETKGNPLQPAPQSAERFSRQGRGKIFDFLGAAINNHKKWSKIVLCCVLLALAVWYLAVFFSQGIRFGEKGVFLTRHQQGETVLYTRDSFWGGELSVIVSPGLDGNSEITYRLPDGQIQTYFLWLGEQADYQRPITIYSQKGKPLFQGNYQKDGLFLFSDTGEIYFGEIEVSFNKDNPYENFQPSYYEMARIVTGDGVVSRGEGWSALLALLLFAMTAIDIRWPLLGFQLSHMWWVEDPQPTDLYIFCQRVSWVVMSGIGIVLLLISIW